MPSKRRMGPLIASAVAAVVGLAAIAVIVRSSITQSSVHATRISKTHVVRVPVTANRLAFVPADAVLTAAPEPNPNPNPVLEPDFGEFRPSLATEPETVDISPWATDVHPRLLAPRTAGPTASPPRVRERVRPRSLKTRLAQLEPAASARLALKFQAAKESWPPDEIALIAIKDERVVELYARSAGAPWTRIHRYPVLAASGRSGPKLHRGDRQVPEGIYRISYLNPNSAYHVSLRVNYPNTFDREMAKLDGRKDLGGDIMIHGKNLSAGCLAMGDEAAEELFVLAAEVGLSKTRLIIAPKDFRDAKPAPLNPGEPKWQADLYDKVAVAMSEFKRPQSRGLLSFFTR